MFLGDGAILGKKQKPSYNKRVAFILISSFVGRTVAVTHLGALSRFSTQNSCAYQSLAELVVAFLYIEVSLISSLKSLHAE